jgi:hypothetical protein
VGAMIGIMTAHILSQQIRLFIATIAKRIKALNCRKQHLTA